MTANSVVVSGGFDDLRSAQVRFLEEAAKLGPLDVLLWSDAAITRLEGRKPKFPQAEREYFLRAIRYVEGVNLSCDLAGPDCLSLPNALRPAAWVVDEASDNEAKRAYCRAHGLQYRVLRPEDLRGLPGDLPEPPDNSARKRVLVTGCYDWFHSGHVRFFEEVSELGDLYVVVGHDANIKLLKGDGHPLFPESERRYLVQSIRYVTQALVSTGQGWLDAEPEIRRIKPHIYAVNEDGDRPEKRQYCESHGIEYRVLRRLPKQGLPRRESTDLRGF
jgi:cytidyltransferase-like protein